MKFAETCDASPAHDDEQKLTLRAYGWKPGDFQLVNGWWREQYGCDFPENVVPPLGVIVELDGEPVAGMWAYQSAGIGVAFLDLTIAAPGLTDDAARAALTHGLHGIETVLRADDYGILRCMCAPGTEEFLYSLGFIGENRNLVKIL